MKKKKEVKTKDHADFQSPYHQSSNFGREGNAELLSPTKNGVIKINGSKEEALSGNDKQIIADAMDRMREKIEMTPGGSQTDILKEEE